jgi:hypothetical protein
MAVANEGLRLWSGTPRGFRGFGLKYERGVAHGRWLALEFSVPERAERLRCLIDRDKRVINWARTSRELRNGPDQGVNPLGAALVTLPIALTLAPLVALKVAVNVRAERRSGMDRNALAFYRAVSRQIPKIFRDELREALRNARKLELAKRAADRQTVDRGTARKRRHD